MAKILLIDDDQDMVDAYRMMLTARGHQVDAAASAAEARLTLAKPDTPDLVVLDVMMETQTVGFELAREIHHRFPQLPIIMLSAVRETTGVPFRFEPDEDWLPVVQFIEKPADPQLVIDQIEQALRRAD